MILKYCIINWFYYTCSFGCLSQVFIMISHFFPEKNPFLFFGIQLLISLHLLNFLQSGLHSKIGLPKRHNLFSRISILHNQVTGVTG